MALLPILTYPDSRLREISKPVEKVKEEMKKLADDMLETMYHAKGIGLAAPQVGELIQLLVIDIRRPSDPKEDEEDELTELESKIKFPLVLFNPKVLEGEGKITYDEGCLSLPGYYETVERYEWVRVSALNREGKEIKIETDGLLAICIQHEMDHLEGKLFIDRLSFVKSSKIKNKIKKVGYPILKERERLAQEKELDQDLSPSVSSKKKNEIKENNSEKELRPKSKVKRKVEV